MLADLAKKGKIPRLAERLPETPGVVEPVSEKGHYGQTWRSVISGAAETYFVSCQIGYDWLVTWSRDWSRVVPNVAESFEVDDSLREYRFGLRKRMKWSDGEPFTEDDIVFAYEDVFKNGDLYPAGIPTHFQDPAGAAAQLEAAEQRVTFKFKNTTALFLPDLAAFGGGPTAYPRHYLKKFHIKYNPEADDLAKDKGYRDWVELFGAQADAWSNAELPTLFPWRVAKPISGRGLEATRNPYYWKTDPRGSQLPYIDRVVFDVVTSAQTINLKTMHGDFDLNFQYGTKPRNKPVFARNRQSGGYHFADMVNTSMNDMMIALNLTHEDEQMRRLIREKEFRAGLSHAINRQEIIDTVYQHQGEPFQAGPRPESEFYDEELAKQYTKYDPAIGNRYLDRVLPNKDADGRRQFDDGTPVAISVEAVDDRPWWVDSLELVKKYWKDVGVELRIKVEDRSLWSERIAANKHDAAVWTGDAGLRDAVQYPQWYFPANSGSRYAVPWADWYLSRGKDGEEPPEGPRRQMKLYDEFQMTADEGRRKDIFREILRIAKEEFYAIGTLMPALKYAIVKNDFHNVPKKFYYGATYQFNGPNRTEQYYKAKGRRG